MKKQTEYAVINLPEPDFIFYGAKSKEVLRITSDRKVIITGDIYEAAKVFWEVCENLMKGEFEIVKGSEYENKSD